MACKFLTKASVNDLLKFGQYILSAKNINVMHSINVDKNTNEEHTFVKIPRSFDRIIDTTEPTLDIYYVDDVYMEFLEYKHLSVYTKEEIQEHGVNCLSKHLYIKTNKSNVNIMCTTGSAYYDDIDTMCQLLTPVNMIDILHFSNSILNRKKIVFSYTLSNSEYNVPRNCIRIPRTFDAIVGSDESNLSIVDFMGNSLGVFNHKINPVFIAVCACPFTELYISTTKKEITLICATYDIRTRDSVMEKYTNFYDESLKLRYNDGSVYRYEHNSEL